MYASARPIGSCSSSSASWMRARPVFELALQQQAVAEVLERVAVAQLFVAAVGDSSAIASDSLKHSMAVRDLRVELVDVAELEEDDAAPRRLARFLGGAQRELPVEERALEIVLEAVLVLQRVRGEVDVAQVAAAHDHARQLVDLGARALERDHRVGFVDRDQLARFPRRRRGRAPRRRRRAPLRSRRGERRASASWRSSSIRVLHV